jgi:hypothetical protein
MRGGEVVVVNKFAHTPEGFVRVDTTSKGGEWAGLSPFLIGPCSLYDDIVSKNMENAWQFAKVYEEDADDDGNPTDAYWEWARRGWSDARAHRYPKGKGAKPLYSLWRGRRLDYIEARKVIYAPLYSAAVRVTDSWSSLLNLHRAGVSVALADFDGYNHDSFGMSLTDVLHEPTKKMGHAFVLKALLTGDPVLKYFAGG